MNTSSRAREAIVRAIATLIVACMPFVSQSAKAQAKAAADEIMPPKMDRDKVVRKLAAPVTDVAVGGGGRYFVLHQPSLRKLAVFDVNTGDVVGSIPAEDDVVLFTAGAKKLFLTLGNTSVVQRYSLETLERELSVPFPAKAKIEGLYLGSAAYSPMLVAGVGADKKATAFFVETGRLRLVNVQPPPGKQSISFSGGQFVRVSANGHVFTSWTPGSSPQGMNVLMLSGAQALQGYQHDSFGHLVPSPDGKIIYTGRGPYTPEGKPLSKNDKKNEQYTLPAVHGNNFYLSVTNRKQLDVHFTGDERPFASLKDIELPDGIDPWARKPFGPDKRILYIPDANLIVTIPADDRIVLHRFDFEDALRKTDLDYLVVTSRPPTNVRRGGTLKYMLNVRSKNPVAGYRVESGPEGVMVSNKGEVTWGVLLNANLGERTIVIAVKSAGGQEKLHNFTVSVVP
jgi:hypothetical protein